MRARRPRLDAAARARHAAARPRIAEPHLADYSLESLAAWLGVEITDRHSALGDARAAARIFHALVPKLRESGIRTLAEAAQACRSDQVIEEQHRAGWSEAGAIARCDEPRELPHRQLSLPPSHRRHHGAPARFIAPKRRSAPLAE